MTPWTADDAPDRAGTTAIVTGANAGLGFETTRLLADAGARVVMACRSVDRGEDARARIERAVPGADLAVEHCDLADLDSVRAFADRVADEYGECHALCNNAGVMATPRCETADGFELQFGVNHLGHFALTGHLLDTLLDTPGEARVVAHASGVHERGTLDFEDLHGEREYDRWAAYAQSKLANVLFAYELDRRFAAADADAIALACHPGWAATNLQERGPRMEGSRLKLVAMRALNRLFGQSPERGALPLVYAATAEDVHGREYVGPGGLLNVRGYPEKQRSSDRSYDRDLAARLWRVSEDLTGVEYGLTPRAEA